MKPQTLGRMTISKVMEMESGLPLPMIFPDVSAQDLASLSRWYSDDTITADPATSMITLSMHSFVVQLNGQNILIDSCNGNCKQRSLPDANQLNTRYLENLAKLGLRPEDIHMVMCTHLHFDHVGWNTRLENGRWVPTFPNARYIFGRRDYDHWSTQEDIPPHREAYEDSVLPVVEAGLADIVDTDHPRATVQEIGDGLWLEPAYGHSPGNYVVHAKSGGAAATFWGDVIHHPVQLLRPELQLMFDDDAAIAGQVRQALMAQLSETDTLCCPAHFRGSSAGYIRNDGEAYRYEFVD